MAIVAAALMAIQAIRTPVRNSGATGELQAPPDVPAALRRACYQCHSQETNWPWYVQFAPLSWFVHGRVSAARRRLDFSAWRDYLYDPGTAARKLGAIDQMMHSGAMPPWYYRLLSARARITPAERAAIETWAIEGRAAALKAEPQ